VSSGRGTRNDPRVSLVLYPMIVTPDARVLPIREPVSIRPVAYPRMRQNALGLIALATREVRRADPRGFLAAAGLQLLGAAAALGVVGSGKLAFDAVLDPGGSTNGLILAMVALALTSTLVGSVGVLQTQQQRLLGERVAQSVWARVLDAAGRVDMITYESTGFATRLERVQQNAVMRPTTVATSLLGLSGAAIGAVAMSGLLLAIQPLLLPILLAAGLPAVLLARRVGKLEFGFATRVTPTARRRHYLRQLLSQRPFAAELRAYGSGPRLGAAHDGLNREFVTELRTHVRKRQATAVLTTLAVGVALALALVAIVALVRSGRLSLAEAGAAAIAVRLLSSQLATVFSSVGSLFECAPFLADLNDFVGSAPPAVPPGTARPLCGAVTLHDVRFRYPERERPALDGVDLRIGAGEVVALVGENGSGKTTLAKIVAGLYEPEEGGLEWDGDRVPASDVRASVSMIFQDFVRYQMAVRENVAVGDPDRPPDDAPVASAVERAGFASTLDSLPDGLDTMLGRELDEGTDLSGGQWQRLALARALFRDRPLVVLDEPTAALDPRAEAALFRDVRAVLDGRAALLISHRFSSVRLADRIYVLDAGRVVECGTHDELIAKKGQYAELYALQSAAYR
jgi:ATP-binding cassette, subfamily B, bacterial